MSGYFDALLRSAGSPLAAAPAEVMPALTLPGDAAPPLEQEVVIEAVTPPSLPVEQASLAAVDTLSIVPEPLLAESPRVPRQSNREETPALPRQPDSGQPVPRQPDSGLPLPPLMPLAAPSEVHPVVRAALRWVGADAAVVEREAANAGVPAGPGTAAVRPLPAVPAPVARSARRADRDEPDGPKARGPVPDRALPLQSPRPLPPDPEMDLSWPVSPAQPAHAGAGEGRAFESQADHVEVHIGTIHVAVDAPAPARATVQPAVPPQRVQARPAARSGFGRSRLPRF